MYLVLWAAHEALLQRVSAVVSQAGCPWGWWLGTKDEGNCASISHHSNNCITLTKCSSWLHWYKFFSTKNILSLNFLWVLLKGHDREEKKKKPTKITSDLQIKIHGDLFTSNSNSIDQILTELSILVQSLQKVFLSLLPSFSQNLNLLRILWWKVLIRISHWYSLCKSNLEYEFSGSRAYISRGLGLTVYSVKSFTERTLKVWSTRLLPGFQ